MIEMKRRLNWMRKVVKKIYDVFVAEDIEPRVEVSLRRAAQHVLNERRSCVRLIDRLATMETTISNRMEEHSQLAALEESFLTNRQARTAGQLTKIATVIVPCTWIFSMGGSFAAGEDLFYVYWAISVPPTVTLLVWVIYKEVLQWWNDPETKSWVGQKKVALKESMFWKPSELREVEKDERSAVREEKEL